jgi:hypothetical protein
MPPETESAPVNQYREARQKKFPNYFALQQWYFGLGEGAERRQFLQQFPELRDYWRWSRDYKIENPELQAIEGERIPFETVADAHEYDKYLDLREEMFPDIAIQDEYYRYPQGSAERRAILAQNPVLKAYWDWNRAYKARNPLIAKYSQMMGQAAAGDHGLDFSFLEQFSPALIRQTMGHYYANQPLSSGALKELEYLWLKAGKPGGTFETFVGSLLRDLVIPQQ